MRNIIFYILLGYISVTFGYSTVLLRRAGYRKTCWMPVIGIVAFWILLAIS